MRRALALPLIGLVAVGLLVGLLGGLTATAQAQDSPPDAPTVARIYFHSRAGLQQLAATLDVWEVNHADGYVLTPVDAAVQDWLTEQGFWVAPDLAATADMRAVQTLATRAHAPADIPGFACYRTVEDTYADLAALADNHPDLAEWVDIGDSWNKTQAGNGIEGYDLRVLVLTNRNSSAPKAVFFLMSAIHARELATAELTARFAEQLVGEYGRDPDVTWLLDHTEVHILPMANPDGRKFAEQLVYWRKNTNDTDGCVSFPNYGVDLNRNSSFKWNQCEGFDCSSGNACAITYRGSGPASEPEVQAFQDYVLGLFPDQRGPGDADAAATDATGLFLSLHSYGRLVLYPWGWSQSPSPNAVQLRTLGRKFGWHTDYAVCQVSQPGCIYQVDGSSDDWAYGELGVAAFTFEIGTTFFQSCRYFETEILGDNLAALHFGAKAARRPYQSPAGPEALDVRISPSAVSAGELITLTAQLDDTRFASNGYGVEPTQTISAAHYTLDMPAWITGTGAFTMAAADGAFDSPTEEVAAAIDTTGWTPGRHLLFVEGQDADGNWGAPTAQFVEIIDSRVGMDLTPVNLSGESPPGKQIAYSVALTNTGAISDSYGLALGPHGWPTVLATEVITLPPGATAVIGWTTRTPLSATIGSSDTVTISVTSRTVPALQRTLRATTTAIHHDVHLPIVARKEQ